MQVFKFGGASVNSAESIRNIVTIINRIKSQKIVVISAMGKMTNQLEKVCDSFFYKKDDLKQNLNSVLDFHLEIAKSLFNGNYSSYETIINSELKKLEDYICREPSLDYDYEYDQIVSFGEILSTKIISCYLKNINIANKWIDSRICIKTDDNYRDAKVNWELTKEMCDKNFDLTTNNLFITQGFIGGTINNLSTTLGREGSDFTAAIYANVFDVENVTVWKDVPGILNADPRWIKDCEKIDCLSYTEAVELAFFGAKVIHPKTIKPLENKKIPLYVNSFLHPENKGTCISEVQIKNEIPVFVKKENQILITIKPIDFSFIIEENISYFFSLFAKHKIKINMIQNSAISFTVSVDNNVKRISTLIKELKDNFIVKYNDNLELYTIRNFTKKIVDNIVKNKEILLDQRTRNTIRIVVR